MNDSLWFGALLVASALVRAAEHDPLHSAACGQALQSLQAQESAAAAASAAAIKPALLAARKAAALACLGASPDALPQRPAVLRAPISVSPIVVPDVSSLSVPRPTQATSTVPRPPILSAASCDALGCTASDGTRLTRVGPLLMGPRGACTVQGSVLTCP